MLAAISLGVWMMLFTAAFMQGMVEQQVQDTISNLTGHVQIHNPKYRDDPAIENSMDIGLSKLDRVLEDPEVKQLSTRVRLPAVIASERETRGVTLVGIRPQNEAGLSFIADSITSGRYLTSSSDNGVIIGKALAEKLETDLGKRIVIMSQDSDNQVADRGFRIVGIYRAELQGTELAYAFTGLDTARAMLKMGEQVSEVSLVSDERENLDSLANRLRNKFPDLEVMTWKELLPLLVASVELYDAILIFWYLIIFIAMSFGLVNTLLMAVFERTREIGLFQALGMSPRFIILQILVESLILLLIGLVVGNLLSWITVISLSGGINLAAFSQGMEWVQMGSMLVPLLYMKDIITSNLLVIVLGLFASLYPAVRAARAVPVDAITRS
ncbi:MAG: ABC transporter permease [Gammaproteobacteria bacterium]|nr:ABC transporter permease [Gammaproteobacteria bacterium]